MPNNLTNTLDTQINDITNILKDPAAPDVSSLDKELVAAEINMMIEATINQLLKQEDEVQRMRQKAEQIKTATIAVAKDKITKSNNRIQGEKLLELERALQKVAQSINDTVMSLLIPKTDADEIIESDEKKNQNDQETLLIARQAMKRYEEIMATIFKGEKPVGSFQDVTGHLISIVHNADFLLAQEDDREDTLLMIQRAGYSMLAYLDIFEKNLFVQLMEKSGEHPLYLKNIFIGLQNEFSRSKGKSVHIEYVRKLLVIFNWPTEYTF